MLLLLCLTQLFQLRLTAALLLAEQVRHWLGSAVRVRCNAVVTPLLTMPALQFL